ncbi:hypothetical protein B0O99DRAFT_694153 [Bisporella sp. PMI_857]|nr:hypothetical protein B0O99DRAFT_694153 [Bisporella sp. PMI_857]
MHSLLLQVKIQVTEDTFVSREGSRKDQVDLGVDRPMPSPCGDIPREMVKKGFVKQPMAKAGKAVLCMMADLADRLGFASTQITTLRDHPVVRNIGDFHVPVPAHNGIYNLLSSGRLHKSTAAWASLSWNIIFCIAQATVTQQQKLLEFSLSSSISISN